MRIRSVLIILAIFVIQTYGANYTYCQGADPIRSVDTEGMELRFVIVISRHGDRTPDWTLPVPPGDHDVAWNCSLNSLHLPSNGTDLFEPLDIPRLYRKVYTPNRETLLGNCAFGQLTSKGFEQTQRLGRLLRQIYHDDYKFMPDTYKKDFFWLRSTDAPRTVQSAEGIMLGLFPNNSREELLEAIPIHVIDNPIENMYYNAALCPEVSAVYDALHETKAWKEHIAKYTPLREQLATIFGTEDFAPWHGLADAMFARQCHGFPLPKGVTDEMLDQISIAANWELTYVFSHPLASKLTIGSFVKDILDSVDNFVNGKKPYQFVYFSGHDDTLAPLLGTMELYDGLWPSYVANMQIELWSKPNKPTDYFVQMKYNGKHLHAPFCASKMCSLVNEWKPHMINQVPSYKECFGQSRSWPFFRA